MKRYLLILILTILIFTTIANAALIQNYDNNWVDTFADNDYTNNPTWTLRAGTASAASGYLDITALDGYLDTPNTGYTYMPDQNLFWEAKMYHSNAGGQAVFTIATTTGWIPNKSYQVNCDPGSGCRFMYYDGGWNELIAHAGTFNQSTWHKLRLERWTDNNFLIYLDDSLISSVTHSAQTDANYFGFYSGSQAGGRIDDVNIGTIVWYETANLTAALTTTTDKTTTTINLNDASSSTGTINDWNWLVNSTTTGITNANAQNTTFTTANQLTDYNIQLCVGDDQDLTECATTTVATGDWEIPAITDTNTQILNATTDRIWFTCTDNNSGCNNLIYSLDGGADTNASFTGAYTYIDVTGGGSHTITYNASDNGLYQGENQTTDSNTYTWTKYGQLTINFYDEKTKLAISANSVLDGNQQTGTTINYNLNDDFTTEDAKYTITMSKTGYTTRYYELDLNKYTTKTINFLIAPNDTNTTTDIQFKFYDDSEFNTKLLNNAYVTIKNTANDWNIVGRIQTDNQGLATFSLMYDQTAYNFYIEDDDGTTYDYNSINITINKPKDEITNTTIDGNWSTSISGLTRTQYYNIDSATKTYALYSNTYDTYNIWVDTNSTNDYYERYYSYRRPGIWNAHNTDWNTLQPYLLQVGTCSQCGSEITYTVLTEGGSYAVKALVNIYKTMGNGLELIASRETDGSGKMKVTLKDQDTYYYEIYYEGQIRYINGKAGEYYTATAPTQTLRFSLENLQISDRQVFCWYITPTKFNVNTTGTLNCVNPKGRTYKIERYLNGTLVASNTYTATQKYYNWTMNTAGTYTIKIYKDYDGNSQLFNDVNFIYASLNQTYGTETQTASEMTFALSTTDPTAQKALFFISFLALIFISIGARITIDKGMETWMFGAVIMGIITGGLIPWLIASIVSGLWMMASVSKGMDK